MIGKKYIFRQFHVEGFVNEYYASFSEEGKTIIFDSRAIENLPPGWKARVTSARRTSAHTDVTAGGGGRSSHARSTSEV